MTRLAILILVVLLAITTREWLVLRARQRQRGLLRRWPIRKRPLVHIWGTTLVAYRNGNVTAAGNR